MKYLQLINAKIESLNRMSSLERNVGNFECVIIIYKVNAHVSGHRRISLNVEKIGLSGVGHYEVSSGGFPLPQNS